MEVSMTYYGAKELAESTRTVRNNTITIAEDIPEDKYGYRPAPGSRSVAETLVHIAVSNRFQYQAHAVERRTSLVGFDFLAIRKEIQAEEKKTRSKADILELLKTKGEAWAQWVDGLTEEFLGEKVAFPPGATPASKSRFEMILSVKEHEMHHRGQLMLAERLLGIVPHLTTRMNARIAEIEAARAKA
jgi:uncharacterized damage-inducible protein DinB